MIFLVIINVSVRMKKTKKKINWKLELKCFLKFMLGWLLLPTIIGTFKGIELICDNLFIRVYTEEELKRKTR